MRGIYDGGVCVQAMLDMNKVMDPQKTAKTMQEFSKQNAKMDMTEDMSESP